MALTLKTSLLDIRATVTLDAPPLGKPPGRYVFQKVAPGLGNLPGAPLGDRQMRAYVIPVDPQTPAQLARRAAFAAAVASWHAATPEQRETVRPLADRRRISLFNAWIATQI